MIAFMTYGRRIVAWPRHTNFANAISEPDILLWIKLQIERTYNQSGQRNATFQIWTGYFPPEQIKHELRKF